MDFDGTPIAAVEAKLPMFIVELPEGYRRGTHLKMEVEFRVRSVRYEENRKGELIQQLILAVEDIALRKVLAPEDEVTTLGHAIEDGTDESEQVSEIDGQVSFEDLHEGITPDEVAESDLADGGGLIEEIAELKDEASRAVESLPYDASVGF